MAIDEVAPGFVVTARCPDGVIEAIESDMEDWFALGTQFHPEAGSASALDIRIFEEFVDGVKELDRKIKEVKSAFGKVKRIKIFGVKAYDYVSGDEIVDEFGMAALSDEVWIPDNSTPFLDDYIESQYLSNNFNF